MALEAAARMESSGTAGLAGQRWYAAARQPRATRGGVGPTRPMAVGHSRQQAAAMPAPRVWRTGSRGAMRTGHGGHAVTEGSGAGPAGWR